MNDVLDTNVKKYVVHSIMSGNAVLISLDQLVSDVMLEYDAKDLSEFLVNHVGYTTLIKTFDIMRENGFSYLWERNDSK